jgi:hypothetical protein
VDNLKVILIAAVIAGHAVLGYTELDAWSYADMREVTLRPAVAYVLLATFAPVDGATRMSWFWRVRPSGPLRLLGPLVARLGRRQEERIWTGLKNHLEGSGPAGAPQSSDQRPLR